MNMSYCRFENTSTDLRDCYENLFSLTDDSDKYELNARANIIRLCAQILGELDIEDYRNADEVDLAIKNLDENMGPSLEDEEE